MAIKTEQLLEAYAIAGIKRHELSAAKRRFVDKIMIMLIQKCNREDRPIGSVSDALKQVMDVAREDPLFS